jgi:PAS domain S-box-containing protein
VEDDPDICLFALIRYWLYRLRRLGAPFVFVGLALLVRWLLDPVLHDKFCYGFFYVAIILTAWNAGIRETVLAVVLGWLVTQWFFVEPRGSFLIVGLNDWLRTGVYSFTGLAIAWFMKSAQAARQRALTSAVEARKWREELEAEKARQREAHATQALLANVVANARDAVICLTPESRITTWNAAAEKLFGFSGQEALGQPLALIVPPEDRAKAEQILGSLQRGEAAQQWQPTLNRKDGSRVEVLLTAASVRDTEGKVIGVSTVAHPRSPGS